MANPRSWSRPDHPRSRGEHSSALAFAIVLPGSSPLTRGALRRQVAPRTRHRIIPAHAGSTHLPIERVFDYTDHPRSRGEHDADTRPAGWHWGSSPLTRGAQGWQFVPFLDDRIIPAHAGSTPLRWSRWTHGRDHPRSRGEHGRLGGLLRRFRGSSPLTRGAP